MNKPLRVYLATCTTPEQSSPVLPSWRENSSCDRYGIHRLTNDADTADLILFVDLHLCPDWRLSALRDHALVRAYQKKVLVYNERDDPWCVLPGLYCSMPAQTLDKRTQRACAYYSGVSFGKSEVAIEPDLLFSFLGSRSHPIRRKVIKLRHPRAVVEDTSGFVFYDRSDLISYNLQKNYYLTTLMRSKFVLCPRGVGTASIRLFETLAAGRVPVIISDDWVAPSGPDWGACSLRVPEEDIGDIPALLESEEANYATRSAAARAAHEAWFAKEVIFHQMISACGELLVAGAPTLRRSHNLRYFQLCVQHLKRQARSFLVQSSTGASPASTFHNPSFMKIAITSLYLPSGSKIGVGYQAHAMANYFVEAKGWHVTMFSPCPKADDALYEQVVVPEGDHLRTFRFAWNLRRYDWSQFDVLHAHGDDNWLWFRKPVHIRTMHGSCMAEAFHIPSLIGKARMTMLGISEMIATLAAHRTVAVSRNTQRSYPWIRRMIPNGVDTRNFRPGEKTPNPTVLFVGTYRNRKRGDLVMREFERCIRPALPNAQLWMVCSDAPDAPGVTVFGRVSEEKLTELYRQAWVFTLPSSYEGFGVPYIEAMASGTPVVATPNPGAKEVLENGRYGRIVQPEQLGSAILELLQNDSERLRLTKLGLERAEIYQWSRVTEQYLALYQELGCRVSAN